MKQIKVEKIMVNSLVIEVTRRCNANCEHCLRGDCENKDIDFSYVEKLLDGVSSIGTITFSGGEPTLNVDVIKKTLDYVTQNDISVDSVFVVTNALHYSNKLVKYMREWLEYCMNCRGYDGNDIWWENFADGEQYRSEELVDYLENYPFGLAVSIDKFHPTPSDFALKRYRRLPYYSKSKETNYYGGKGIISEGRAEENGIGYRTFNDYEYYFSTEYESADEFYVETVYLNSLGNIYPNCDFSYETQDNVIGDVSIINRSLFEIIDDETIRYDYFNVEDEMIV